MELIRVIDTGTPGHVCLVGEIDLSNVEELGWRLQEQWRDGTLIVDVSEVTFLDGRGLQMLIELGRQAAERGATVHVLNGSAAVRRVLDVAVPDGIPGLQVIEKND